MSLNSDDATTKPTLQTVLDRINVLGGNLQKQITSLHDESSISIQFIDRITELTKLLF